MRCHARHAVEANRQLDNVCRQTDRPGHSCLHVWIHYLQWSTWENISIFWHLWTRLETWRRTETAMSWAGHMYTNQSVKDAQLSYVELPDVASIRQTGNLQSHTLHKLCTGLKIILALAEKSIAPSLPWSLTDSVQKHDSNMKCFSSHTLYPQIIFFNSSRLIEANAERNKRESSANCCDMQIRTRAKREKCFILSKLEELHWTAF